MRRASKSMRNKEWLWVFRSKLVRLYEEFEAKLESLCQQEGVKINFWYSPSKIPQPKFVFGGFSIDADTLYDEEKFSLLFSPNGVLERGHSRAGRIREKGYSRLP